MEEVPDAVAGPDDLSVGNYGWSPPGRERIVLGHGSLGRVARAPSGCGAAGGDLVVGVASRPDLVPRGAGARGKSDITLDIITLDIIALDDTSQP